MRDKVDCDPRYTHKHIKHIPFGRFRLFVCCAYLTFIHPELAIKRMWMCASSQFIHLTILRIHRECACDLSLCENKSNLKRFSAHLVENSQQVVATCMQNQIYGKSFKCFHWTFDRCLVKPPKQCIPLHCVWYMLGNKIAKTLVRHILPSKFYIDNNKRGKFLIGVLKWMLS